MAVLLMQRFNYGPLVPENVRGTFGIIELPNRERLWTVEPPWFGNRPFKSCIPEGVYSLKLRPSAIVDRTTEGRHKRGWEITGVPNRTHILFHPANWPDELEGCIGVGQEYGILQGRLGVSQSRLAFETLMAALDPEKDHELEIIPYLVTYP